jgi:hypothetical protein
MSIHLECFIGIALALTFFGMIFVARFYNMHMVIMVKAGESSE